MNIEQLLHPENLLPLLTVAAAILICLWTRDADKDDAAPPPAEPAVGTHQELGRDGGWPRRGFARIPEVMVGGR